MAILIKLIDNDNINDTIIFHNFYYFGIIENFFSYHKDSQLSKFNGNFSNGLHKAKNINTNIVVKKTTLNGSNSMETERNISKENNNIFHPNLLMKKKKKLNSNDNDLMMTSSQFSQESTNSTTPTTTLLPTISTTSITTATSNLSDSFNYEVNGKAKSNDSNLGNYTNLFKYVGKSSR